MDYCLSEEERLRRMFNLELFKILAILETKDDENIGAKTLIEKLIDKGRLSMSEYGIKAFAKYREILLYKTESIKHKAG